MPHPWELTLRQFLDRIRIGYGLELRYSEISATDQVGSSVSFAYLEGVSESAPFVLLPGSFDLADVVPLSLLRSLVARCGLPPEDFHLDPEAPLD